MQKILDFIREGRLLGVICTVEKIFTVGIAHSSQNHWQFLPQNRTGENEWLQQESGGIYNYQRLTALC